MAEPVTAADALHRLVEGNQRFASGNPNDPSVSSATRAELTNGQHPFATVLGCVDSRVPLETIFDQSLGDLLTVRTAGQALDALTLGSVEFGVRALGTELVAVVGHTQCGAVAAALAADRPDGPLGELIIEISERLGHASSADPLEGTRENTDATVRELRSVHSMRLADGRRPVVVGLLYDLASGLVEILDDGALSAG